MLSNPAFSVLASWHSQNQTQLIILRKNPSQSRKSLCLFQNSYSIQFFLPSTTHRNGTRHKYMFTKETTLAAMRNPNLHLTSPAIHFKKVSYTYTPPPRLITYTQAQS